MRQKKRKLTNHNNLLHSDKSTYFYKSSLVIIPAFALLGLLACIINPYGFSGVEKSYAASVSNPNFSITLSLGNTLQTEETLDTGVVGYIANNFTVSSTATRSYSIYLKPATGATSSLKGKNHQQLVPSVSSDVTVSSFTDNTWGYSIGSTGASNDSLTYSAIPDGSKPVKNVANPDDGDDTYKIVFAAKINDDKSADHYQTQMELSVLASPKQMTTLGDITLMKEMNSFYCASLPTPSVNASLDEIPMGQLIDDREGANGQAYWVAKLADGDCWMLQNMAYEGISDKTGNYSASKKNTLLVPNDKNNPTSYTEKEITADMTASTNPTMSTVISADGKTYDSRYLIGNYYTIDNNQAKDACTFASYTGQSDAPGWQLPTSDGSANASAEHGSFSRLAGTYGVASDSAGSLIMRKAPMYFIYSGAFYSRLNGIGTDGYLWSSTPRNGNNGYYNVLNLSGSTANPASYNGNNSNGFSVRCVTSSDTDGRAPEPI